MSSRFGRRFASIASRRLPGNHQWGAVVSDTPPPGGGMVLVVSLAPMLPAPVVAGWDDDGDFAVAHPLMSAAIKARHMISSLANRIPCLPFTLRILSPRHPLCMTRASSSTQFALLGLLSRQSQATRRWTCNDRIANGLGVVFGLRNDRSTCWDYRSGQRVVRPCVVVVQA